SWPWPDLRPAGVVIRSGTRAGPGRRAAAARTRTLLLQQCREVLGVARRGHGRVDLHAVVAVVGGLAVLARGHLALLDLLDQQVLGVDPDVDLFRGDAGRGELLPQAGELARGEVGVLGGE